MARPKGYKCSPETIAKQKATRAENKVKKAAAVVALREAVVPSEPASPEAEAIAKVEAAHTQTAGETWS